MYKTGVYILHMYYIAEHVYYTRVCHTCNNTPVFIHMCNICVADTYAEHMFYTRNKPKTPLK